MSMLPVRFQILDAPMISATLIQNVLSNWPILSKHLSHSDPKSKRTDRTIYIHFFRAIQFIQRQINAHFVFLYLDCLITGTCSNSLSIIIVKYIVNHIFMLRSNLLRLKHLRNMCAISLNIFGYFQFSFGFLFVGSLEAVYNFDI